MGSLAELESIPSKRAISGGELVVRLYELWGKRWLVDRLLQLSGAAENDWLEFKATLCPPKELRECYSEGRNSLVKYVEGDYYLHVVKAVVSLINRHGGAVLLGIAQSGKGALPIPADYNRLCESRHYMPVLFNDQYSQWDTDAWLLYIQNIFRANEWVDRYGTTWNCSEVLDDQYIRFYNGLLDGKPVAVIAAFPTNALPLELKRTVNIGRHSSKGSKRSSAPGHCIRRAKFGGGCHWPHDDPPPVEQTIIPIRSGGNNASVDMKTSFAAVANFWSSREAKQLRFREMAEKESKAFDALDFGFTIALESVLLSSLKRCQYVTPGVEIEITSSTYSTTGKDRQLEEFLSHLQLTKHTNQYAWLTGIDSHFISSILASRCATAINCYHWGDVIPVYVPLSIHLTNSLIRQIIEEREEFISKYLLLRLASSAATKKHWLYMASTFGIHLMLDNLDDLPEDICNALIRAIRYFKEQYFRSYVTIVSGFTMADSQGQYERIELIRNSLKTTRQKSSF